MLKQWLWRWQLPAQPQDKAQTAAGRVFPSLQPALMGWLWATLWALLIHQDLASARTANNQLCSYHKAFCPFLRAAELYFWGRSVRHGVGACWGYQELCWLLIWAALVAWDVKGLMFCLHFAKLSKITSPFPLNKFSCASLGWSTCTWSLHAQTPHTAGCES